MKFHSAVRIAKLLGLLVTILTANLAWCEEKKILIVDDTPVVLNRFKAALQEQFPGVGIIEATNCPEAIDAFKANQNDIELIISDLNMGDLGSGTDLAKEVRKLNQIVPFLLHTANPPKEQGEIDYILRSGVTFILEKGPVRGFQAAIAERVQIYNCNYLRTKLAAL